MPDATLPMDCPDAPRSTISFLPTRFALDRLDLGLRPGGDADIGRHCGERARLAKQLADGPLGALEREEVR